MAFHELTAAELADEHSRLVDEALAAARLAAAQRLINGPVAGVFEPEDAAAVSAALTARATDEPRYELLEAFERPWSLLVVKLISGVLDDASAAIRDARERGVSLAEIAAALGITASGLYKRYGDHVVLRPRRR
jgi:hypothetical protein